MVLVSSGQTTLDYAPRRAWVRRRWKRVALIGLLVGVAAGGWWWRGEISYAWERSAYLRAQERCLRFEPEPDRVAYEESPIPAGKLLASDADYLPHIEQASDDGPRTLALWWPKVARDFSDAFNYTRHTGPKALLFLHERTTPGGRRVLVAMFLYVRPGQPTPLLTYETRISDPATWDAPPRLVGGRGAGVVENVWNYYSTKPVRIYAGRADPADRSRFTMDFELAGQRGVIEGRVTDAEPGTPHFSAEFEISTRGGDPRR